MYTSISFFFATKIDAYKLFFPSTLSVCKIISTKTSYTLIYFFTMCYNNNNNNNNNFKKIILTFLGILINRYSHPVPEHTVWPRFSKPHYKRQPVNSSKQELIKATTQTSMDLFTLTQTDNRSNSTITSTAAKERWEERMHLHEFFFPAAIR